MEQREKEYHKRKKLNLTVKRAFQMWLLVRVLGVVLVSTLAAVLILYFYSRQEISSSFYAAHLQIRRVSDLLLPVMAAGAFISLVSGLLLALFLPQRIAGPLFRIQKSLQTIGSGDLSEQVALRKNDIFQDLASTVNDSAAGLREKIEEIKKTQRELDRMVSSLKKEEVAAVCALQKEALEKLRTE